jgi:hypothetical protein
MIPIILFPSTKKQNFTQSSVREESEHFQDQDKTCACPENAFREKE